MNKYLLLLGFVAGSLGAVPLGIASQRDDTAHGNEPSKAQAVGREVRDAGEAIKDYTVDKREEAARTAREALDDLDERIKTMENRVDRDWDKMDQSAREHARKALDGLRKQRILVAEWYGGLKHSTAGAWQHMKKGFSDSYKDLRRAWEKAERDYAEDRKK